MNSKEPCAERRKQDDQADQRVDGECEPEVEVGQVGVGGDGPIAGHGGVDGAEQESIEHADHVDTSHRDEVTDHADQRLQEESHRVGDRVPHTGDAVDDRHVSGHRRECSR
jgi:hypothetical protein